MSLIIHAPNVHQGGGKALLLSLLAASRKQPTVTALLDRRLELPDGYAGEVTEIRIRPSVAGRLAGEWMLRKLVKESDAVLCFGNLPPLFNVKGSTIVFLQNRYLIERASLKGFSFTIQARIVIERLWFSLRVKHAEKIVVQTPSMQRVAQAVLGRSVQVLPFCGSTGDCEESNAGEPSTPPVAYDFLYVASGEPHKNHAGLIEAWELLAAEGLSPSLCLTVPEQQYPSVAELIRRGKIEHGLRIENVNVGSAANVEDLYRESRAFVYPSLLESFGLPLVQAKQVGLPIIAAELDYVRDVVDPAETFDPRSPVSIARAIKRYLGVPERPRALLSADSFIKTLLGDTQ